MIFRNANGYSRWKNPHAACSAKRDGQIERFKEIIQTSWDSWQKQENAVLVTFEAPPDPNTTFNTDVANENRITRAQRVRHFHPYDAFSVVMTLEFPFCYYVAKLFHFQLVRVGIEI